MNNPRLTRWMAGMFGLCLPLLFAGCQQIADDVTSDSSSAATQTSSVAVTTRAGASDQILYPVTIYAFDETGKQVAAQRVLSASDEIQLSLGVGDYKVVALSGYSKGYTLSEEPTLTDVIRIADSGIAQTPLMMGKADLSITKTGKKLNLEITMSYMVTSVSICLKDVPETVQGVTLSLSSFYTGLTLDGTYADGGKTVEFECEQDDNNEWNADALYLFPSDKSETLYSIILEYADKTETYAYTYSSPLTASQPFNFIGSYAGNVYIGGSLLAAGWQDTKTVSFTFGGTDDDSTVGDGPATNPSNPSDTTNSDVVNAGGYPQLGHVWNAGLVMDVDKISDTEADVLLMTLDEWTTTSGNAADYVAVYQNSTGMAWRLMTDTEAKSVKANMTESVLATISSQIAAQNRTYDDLSSASGVRYLCSKSGVIYTFRFETSGSVTKAGSTKEYLMRLVRTVHYMK